MRAPTMLRKVGARGLPLSLAVSCAESKLIITRSPILVSIFVDRNSSSRSRAPSGSSLRAEMEYSEAMSLTCGVGFAAPGKIMLEDCVISMRWTYFLPTVHLSFNSTGSLADAAPLVSFLDFDPASLDLEQPGITQPATTHSESRRAIFFIKRLRSYRTWLFIDLLISVLFLLFQVPNGQLFLWRFARQARIRVRQLMGQFIKAFGLVRVAGIEPTTFSFGG